MLESRMIMGGSGDEEDEAAARSLFKTTNTNNNLLNEPAPRSLIGGPNFLGSQISSRAFQINPVQSSMQGGLNAETAFSGAVTQDELRAEQELDHYNNQLEQVQDDQDFMGFGVDR